jgi:hypothetical protein
MPTQDELSLAEAVGRLTEENKNLKIEIANLGYSHSTAKAKAFGIAFPLATAIALLGGWITFKSISATGQVDACYIDPYRDQGSNLRFMLKGDVDWAKDKTYGDFPNIEEAKTLAAKLDCWFDVKR